MRYRKFLLIFILFFILNGSKFNYKRILDFEDLKYWTKLKADRNIKKSGAQSGRWVNPLENNRVDCKAIPNDWSKYNAIRFWVYSNKAKNFKFALVIQSENESTDRWDFYMRHFVVNWTGWKEFIIPFDKFVVRRKPIGWSKIDRIRFASTGYALQGIQPADVVLNFDKMELIKITDEFKRKRLKDIMDFEIVSAWSGMEKSSKYVKNGNFSGRWANTEKITRIDCSSLPKNWSKYNALQFWLYSKVANNAGFEIVVISDNAKTKKDDYLRYSITVDWEGWKKIVIPFDRFIEKYNPVGWNKIDKVRLAALGYGHTPKKDTELYFDDLQLVSIELVPRVKLRKHYTDNGRYVNYFEISLKNVSRKKVNYNVRFIKKASDFDFSVKNNKGYILPNKKKNIEIFCVLKKGRIKKYRKNKIPFKEILVEFKTKNFKKVEKLKIYYPFNIKNKHPYIVLSDKDIKNIKNKIKKYNWAQDALKAMKSSAEKYSKGSIPEETGGDFHERIGSYEVTRRHINFSRAARYYGILYRITGKKKYAQQAKKILIKYTKIYPKLKKSDKFGKVGDTADPSGGKICVQLLSDAKWDIFISHTYDLIYDFFSKSEKEKIEYILRDQAEMIMKHKRGAHNFQAVYNSALAVIGYTLQDPAYIDYALNEHSNGFLALQIKKSFTKEMMYYERSPHYHHFIISYLTYLFEAVHNAHFNIYKWKGIKDIFDVLLKITDKEYETPYVNDGGYFNFTDQKRGWPYIIAYKRFKDKKYLWIINKLSRTSPEALLYLPGEIYNKPKEKLSYKKNYNSFILPDTEWAFIRTKKNSYLGDFYFTLKYDQYYSSHTHLDRLGLIVKAFDKFILPDAGSVKYGNPVQSPWFRSTLSHNTVLVDMQPQSLVAVTKLNYFYDSNPFQVVSAKVKGLSADSDILMNRTVFMIDNSYIVDYITVDDLDNVKHKYDLVYHFDGSPDYKSFKPVSAKNIYKNSSPNYTFIDDFKIFALPKKNKDIVVDYKVENNKFVRFWNKGFRGLQIITGAGPISDKREHIRDTKVPLILLRYNKTSAAKFVSIIQPYKKNFVKDKIRRFKILLNTDTAMLFKILKKNGVIEYLYMSKKNGINTEEFTTDASIAYMKIKDGKLYNVVIVGGKTISIYNGKIKTKLSKKSSIAVYYDASVKKYISEKMETRKRRIKATIYGSLINGKSKIILFSN